MIISADRKKLQWQRKAIHIWNGLFGFWLYVYSGIGDKNTALVLLSYIVISLTFDGLRFFSPVFRQKISPFFKGLMRQSENTRLTSATKGLAMTLLLLLLCPKSVNLIVILFMTLGDPIGGIVGSLYGKHKLNEHASFEGSLAVWLTGFLSSLFVFNQLIPHSMGIFTTIIVCLWLGLISAFAEAFLSKWDDNVTIPLVSAPLTWLTLIQLQIL